MEVIFEEFQKKHGYLDIQKIITFPVPSSTLWRVWRLEATERMESFKTSSFMAREVGRFAPQLFVEVY